MFPSWLQIAVVVLLILLFFGRGKISELMGDLGKGLRTFRKGLEGEEKKEGEESSSLPSTLHTDKKKRDRKKKQK